LNVAEFVEVY